MRGQRNKQQVAVTSKNAEVFDDGGENEDEEDESTESEPEWTGEDEKSFLRTLGALKGNVPEIYNKEEKFFKKEAVEWKKKEKKEKKLRPNDYQRQLFEKHDGRVEEDHVEQNGAPIEHGEGYFETQERLKHELKSALTALDSDDEDGGGFLVKKELSEQDKRKAEDEYYEFLKGQQKDEDNEDAAPAADKDIRLLKKVWTDPKIDESEQFLRDYLLNKEYEADSNVDSDAAAALSEEEADVEKQDQFEAKYNFRYEDPDQDFIKTYPRTFASTLREKKDSRKKKREAKKERKLKEKDEIIKKIKLDSVSVAAKLKAESGKEVGEDDLEGDFDPAAHDALMNKLFPDDEPAEGEEMEKPTFSDDDEDDPFKVSLSDDDLLASNANLVPLTTKRKFVRQEPSGDVEMEEAADEDEGEGVGEGEGVDVQEATGEMGEDWQEGEGGDEEEGDEDDMRPRNKKDRRRKRKRAAKRDGKVEEGTEGKRPKWDPSKMTFGEYIDKRYNAECEDVIDDLQTRFKYRKVKANNFGLSLEEILGAEDKELNKWAGFRKVIGCHTEEDEERMFKQYKKREGKKMEVLRSLYKPEVEPEAEESQEKKSKKKSKKEKEAAEAEPSEEPAQPLEDETDGKDTVDNAEKDATETVEGEEAKDGEKKKRTRRRKKNKSANENGEEKKTEENGDEGETRGDAGEKEKEEEEEPKELTPEEEAALQKKKEKEEKKKRALAVKDERLKAYGLNPNKFKHSVKYDKRYGKKFVKKVAKESGDEDSD